MASARPVITAAGPEAAARRAGRPLSYWHGLLRDENLKPMKKPEPKAAVERLPPDQVQNVVSAMRDRDISKIDGTLADWMNDLAKLHPDDTNQIITAALNSSSPTLRTKALDSMLLLPKNQQVDLMIGRLSGSVSQSNAEIILFESIFDACSEADKIRFVRVAFNSLNLRIHAKAAENILMLAEDERIDKAETLSGRAVDHSSYSNSYFDLSDEDSKTFGRIFQSCSEAGKARLVRIAVRSSSTRLQALACENITLLPETERMDAIEKVLAFDHHVRSPKECQDSIKKTFLWMFAGYREAGQARLINAALKAPLEAVRTGACDCIPLLTEGDRADAIETALTSGGPGVAKKAFEHVGACTEKDKARVIKAGLKAQDKSIPKRAFGMIAGRPDESELLMMAINSDHEIMMLAAERVCSLPEDRNLLETASKNVAHAFTIPGLHNDADALSLIPKFPAKYRAVMIGAAIPKHLAEAIQMIPEVPPAQCSELWQNAEKAVVGEITHSRLDESVAGTLPLFPSAERANIVRRALSPPNLDSTLRASQTDFFLRCLRTCELIPDLDPGMQGELWTQAAGTIAKIIGRREKDMREGVLQVATALPAEHLDVVFRRIANSVHPELQEKTAGMLDSMPAQKQAVYIRQAFEAYRSRTRMEAFERVFTLPEQQQIELLECALESSYEDVRMMAAKGKRDIPSKARQALVPSLIGSFDARACVAAAISQLAVDKERKAAVLLALESKDPVIFFTALRSSRGLFKPEESKRIPWRAAFKEVKSALDSNQYEVRMEAAEAIAAFDDRRKYKLTKRALRSKHLGVRQKAVEYAFEYPISFRQRRLAKVALKTEYADNVLKIAFELLAEREAKISNLYAPKLHDLAEERLGKVLGHADILTFGKNSRIDDCVMAHAMELPFPERLIPELAQCAFNSGPQGTLAIAKKAASGAGEISIFLRDEGMTTALHYPRQWAEAVSLIPSFPISEDKRKSFWGVAAATAETALCSGIRPKKAAMLLKTFPTEHWPALVALRDKVRHEPIGFFIAALAIQQPKKFWNRDMQWVSPHISSGMESPDTDIRDQAAQIFFGFADELKLDDNAWKAAAEKTKGMIGSDDAEAVKLALGRVKAFPRKFQSDLIGAAIALKSWRSSLDAIECLAKLPQKPQDENAWLAAVERLKGMIGSDDFEIAKAGCDSIKVLPPLRQAELIETAIRSKWTPVSMDGMKLLAKLPKELPADGAWTAAAEETGLLLGSGENGGEELALERMKTFPPKFQPELIEKVIASKFYERSLNGMDLLAKLPKEHQSDKLWGAASERLRGMLGSEDFLTVWSATSVIKTFPPVRQPELIEAALAVQWWNPVLDAMDLVPKLPPDLQTEKMWIKMFTFTVFANHCEVEHVRDRAVRIALEFPKERYTALLMRVSGQADDIYLKKLVGKALESKRLALVAPVVSCISKFPADYQKGAYGIAANEIAVMLGSDDAAISRNASELMSSFPPESQSGLIENAMACTWGFARTEAMKLLIKLPPNLQTDKCWDGAKRQAKAVLTGKSLTATPIDAEAMVETVAGFPKKYQEEVLLDVLGSISEGLTPRLVELGLGCENPHVAIPAADAVCRMVKISVPDLDTLPKGDEVYIPPERVHLLVLLAKAQQVVLNGLGSKDHGIMSMASECIGGFPPGSQVQLIKASMEHGFWTRVLNGIALLQKLPEKYQTPELWDSAQAFTRLAFKDSQGNFARRRVMELLPGFPKARLAELIAIAEKSEFEDVRASCKKPV